MRSCCLALTLFAMLVAHSTVAGAQRDGDKPAAASPSLDGLEAKWKAEFATLHVPGMAVAVVRRDQTLLAKGFGTRDAEGKKPVTPDTIFYIASCTKPYVAFLLAALAEEGKLGLDDPVKKRLPRFQLADPYWTSKLTVRDLLSHRQGLNSFPIVFLDAFTGDITDDRYFRFLARANPAGECHYSNVHFTLAGRVAEAVGGKSWRHLLQERLFDRAGMRRTTAYASRMYADADAAIPLEPEGDRWKASAIRKTDRTMHAAGGIGTTAQDLALWMRININGGEVDGKRLLSAEGIADMQRVHAPSRQADSLLPDHRADGFGLGWQIGRYRGYETVSHAGGYIGTTAYICLVPAEGIGAAAVANTSDAAQRAPELVVMDAIHRLLDLEDHGKWPKLEQQAAQEREGRRATAATSDRDPSEAGGLTLRPEAFAGTFESADWGTIRIACRAGKLDVKIGDLPVRLRSTGPNLAQMEIQPGTYRDAEFVVDKTAVTAVILHWNDAGNARFDRKAP